MKQNKNQNKSLPANAAGRLLLAARGIEKSYGGRTVLRLGSLSVYDGQRIGLIGENGAGKSTLLSILAGEEEPDAGEIRRYCGIGFIRQQGRTDQEADAELKSRFHAPEMREGLSGGEQTRRRIAGALSQSAQLLFADEPSADLDQEGIRALTEALRRFRGALLLVSHDRSLLNGLCTHIWHLEDGNISVFPGNYDSYQRELTQRRAFQQFEYDQYRAEQKRLKEAAQQKIEWAASVKKAPKRMGNSEARLHTREYTNAVIAQSHAATKLRDRLDRLEKKERPRSLPDIRMKLGAEYPIRARYALEADITSLSAGGRMLLEKSAFTLPSGSRTAVTGNNGCGKTSLLLSLLGRADRDIRLEGTVRWNPAARVGCFDQEYSRMLEAERTALENVLFGTAPDVSRARTVLARLGLRGDAVLKPVRVLSGGEQAKTALARLMLSDCNVLVLDEPTNHLDVFALEALQKLLGEYEGTLLFVSHDETLVRHVADRIVRFEDKGLRTEEGNDLKKE